MSAHLPFKISTLVFVKDRDQRLLLIHRAKAPNKGCWSPIGGKLEMSLGESPYECARREVAEEIGCTVHDGDLRMFSYISEKHYEGKTHWLMFLFDCLKPLDGLPEAIDEGPFRFFPRAAIDGLPIPVTDRTLLWPYYDRYRAGFIGLRADCDPGGDLKVVEELTINPPPSAPGEAHCEPEP